MINYSNYTNYRANYPTASQSFRGIFRSKTQNIQNETIQSYGIDKNCKKSLFELQNIDKLKERTEKFLKTNQITIPNLKPENFYIDIPGYTKNPEWAEFMAESSKFAALNIKNGASFENSLKQISEDYNDYLTSTSRLLSDLQKNEEVGVSRLEFSKGDLITPYSINSGRYQTYYERFKTKYQDRNKKPELSDFKPVTILHYEKSKSGNILHRQENVEAGMKHSKQIFNELTQKYLNKSLNKRDIQEINSKMAELHWFLANSTPYLRGSDCITSAFIKSLYAALGFEMSPAKSGVNFDLEAFCMTKSEYVKNYTKLYENPPKYVG